MSMRVASMRFFVELIPPVPSLPRGALLRGVWRSAQNDSHGSPVRCPTAFSARIMKDVKWEMRNDEMTVMSRLIDEITFFEF